jgi:hypothetical protein
VIIYIRTREVDKEVRLSRSQVAAVNEQLDRCNLEGDFVTNEEFIHGIAGNPIELLVGGDKWIVFDRSGGHNTIFVEDNSSPADTVVADELLYWEVAKQSGHPVYWIDCNRCDETVWYGTVEEMCELLDDGYFPKLFHGPIEPDGKSVMVPVTSGGVKVAQKWEVLRWSDRGNPPPRLC